MNTLYNLLALTALSAGFTACASDKKDTPTAEPAVAVTTLRPTSSQHNELVVSGAVTSRQTAMISTRHMGLVDRIMVKQGDAVRAGQLLVTIHSADLQAKRQQAEAMVAEAQAATLNAEKDAARFRKLHAQNSVSDKELENVELQLTSMRAKLRMARQGLQEVKAMMAYTHLTAPFSGVVAQKLVDEGSMANPGHPLLVLEQAGDLVVTASVPEEYLTAVKVGDAVRVEVKALHRTFSGRVVELSPSATMTGGQYAMKVSLSAAAKQELRSGMYASVYLSAAAPRSEQTASADRVYVDASAIVRRDQLTGVYVLSDDQRVYLRWVRLGKTQGAQVEVLAGLKAQETLVLPQGQKLRNGQKVTTNG